MDQKFDKHLNISDQSISVVIPTLNRCSTLRRAIDSVLNQTLHANEIIVVDNGSTDGTEQLILNEYPQVRFLKEFKIGVSAARNTGIKAAIGEWVGFLDSDDEWLNKKLEVQLTKHLLSHANTKLIHTDEIWNKNGKRVNQMNKHKKFGGDIFSKCLKLCCVSPSSALVKKNLFNEVGLFDEDLPACEDYDMWLRIAANEEVLFIEEELIIKYGGHSDQLSKKFWGMDRFRILSLEKILKGGALNPTQRIEALDMVIKKSRILMGGGLKRGNSEISTLYSDKLDFWTGELSLVEPKASFLIDV